MCYITNTTITNKNINSTKHITNEKNTKLRAAFKFLVSINFYANLTKIFAIKVQYNLKFKKVTICPTIILLR